MKPQRYDSIILSVLFLVAMLFAGCGTTVDLASGWKTTEVIIDGQESDWTGATVFVSHSKVAVGVRNDQDNLYVCIIAKDQRTQMQIMGLGFMLWLDPTGNQEKTSGIHYPIGGQFRRRELSGAEESLEDRRRAYEESLREFEILGPGKDERQIVPLITAKGIILKIGNSEAGLVYEAKIPLRRSPENSYAIGAEPGNLINIGFDSGESSERLTGGSGGVDRTSASRPSGRGGRGGRGQSGTSSPGAAASERPEPIRFWANVRLATSSTQAQ